jgi:REP element-mobilizing transposase RayT
MPQSLSQVALHITYSTKYRQTFLEDPDVRSELYAYMAKVLQNIKCDPIIINGVEDHIHILCNLSRTITIADLIEESKKATSKWIKLRMTSIGIFIGNWVTAHSE